MDRAGYIHKRKARYMAQVLEEFERELQDLLPAEAAGRAQSFKGLVRARMNALAVDAVDILALQDMEQNGLAVEMRDALSPTGRP